MSSTETIQALLFDLGGVVVDIDFRRAFNHWAPYSALSPEDMALRFDYDIAFQRFERGETPAQDYFTELQRRFEISSQDHMLPGWKSIIIDVIPSTLATLYALRQTHPKLPLYAFTNINEVHKAHLLTHYPQVLNAFDQVFYSSDMGMRKPEERAFRYVSDTIHTPVQHILFMDDLISNVEGARQSGLHAEMITKPADVQQALAKFGIRSD